MSDDGDLARQQAIDYLRPKAAGPAPLPLPGWYAHPTMADTQRYWDGTAWTDHITAGAPSPRPVETAASAARFRRVWLAAGVAVLVAAVLVAVAFWPAGKVTIDGARLEPEIKAWATTDLGAVGAVTVDCPDDFSGHPGDDFHCLVTDSTGSVRVDVTIENNDGDVTWVLG